MLPLNRKEWHDFIKQNTKYNENGDAVISKDDEWFYEDVWDDDYEKILLNSTQPTVGGDQNVLG